MGRELLKLFLGLFIIVIGFQSSSAQVVRHSYRFNNTFSASEPDCGPDLIQEKALGNCGAGTVPGAFISDSLPLCKSRRTLYHTNLHWGLSYPNPNGAISTTYTIHMYVKNTNWGPKQWVRILDFSSTPNKDVGIYFEKSLFSNDYCLRFWPTGVVGKCPYFNYTDYYLLSFTRNGATGIIDVYVNGSLFTSYKDNANEYVAIAGQPIFIYRDDQNVQCESGQANFAYLSFSNQYSSQADVTAVYNNICKIATVNTADFNFSAAGSCGTNKNVTVSYTGNIVPPGTGYTFNWDWDGGNVVSGSGMGPFVVNWSTPGTKNVKLAITGGTCAAPVNKTLPIVVGDLKVSGAVVPAGCTGNTGTITATPGGGALPYQYSLDGVNFQSSNIFNVAAGQYNITVKDANSCTANTAVDVPLINDLTLQTRSDTSVCKGSPVTLATSSNGTGFLWQPATGLDNPNIKDPVANPASTTAYTVTATAGTCSKTSTVKVTVTQPVVISASSLPADCNNSKGTITITANGGSLPYRYSLDNVTYQNSNIFNVAAGTYEVYVKDANNCNAVITIAVLTNSSLNLQTRPDTSVCAGQPVKLVTASNATVFSWQPATGLDNPNIKDPVASPLFTTDYVVTASNSTCTRKDTVRIVITQPVNVTATTSPANCSGNATGGITANVNGGAPPYQYSLNGSDYQKNNSFTVAAGQYSVFVKDANNCISNTSVVVGSVNDMALQAAADTTICQGQAVTLTTLSNAASFTWQPATGLDNANMKSPVATPLVSTNYIVTATSGNCVKKDTIRITVTQSIKVITNADSVVIADQPFQLTAYSPQLAGSPGVSYLWSPSIGLNNPAIANPIAILKSDQSYRVEVTSVQGCKGSATVTIKVLKGPDIFVPTGFSPNGDGSNDILKPICIGIQSLKFFKVFNRWGKVIYSTSAFNQGWDGTIQGMVQPTGAYVWMVEATSVLGQVISKKGSFVLIR